MNSIADFKPIAGEEDCKEHNVAIMLALGNDFHSPFQTFWRGRLPGAQGCHNVGLGQVTVPCSGNHQKYDTIQLLLVGVGAMSKVVQVPGNGPIVSYFTDGDGGSTTVLYCVLSN